MSTRLKSNLRWILAVGAVATALLFAMGPSIQANDGLPCGSTNKSTYYEGAEDCVGAATNCLETTACEPG